MTRRWCVPLLMLVTLADRSHAQCNLSEVQDPGNGIVRLMCPINGYQYNGLDVPFIWDPDDEQGPLGSIFPRRGEHWQLTSNVNDSTSIGFFNNFVLSATNSPISYCIATPSYPCSQSGIVVDHDDWIDQSHNLRVLNDSGQTFWWQAQECNNISCNFPWVKTSFKNGPSASPATPTILSPAENSLVTDPDVLVDWRNGDRARNHYLEVRGEMARDGDPSWPIVFTKKPLDLLPDTGALAAYPATGVYLGDPADPTDGLGAFKDGRQYQVRLAAVNELGQSNYFTRTFRVPAIRQPDAIDPNSIDECPEWSFDSGCVAIVADQPFGGAVVEFEAAKDVVFAQSVYDTQAWFNPKSHKGKVQFCPPPDLGRTFWFRMRAWNQDYGYGPYWGSPCRLIHPPGEFCAIPTIGHGQGAREYINHVESCLNDADPNAAFSWKLWDKSRYFNRNVHNHNGLQQPYHYSAETRFGGTFAFKMSGLTDAPSEDTIVADGNNDWGDVGEADATARKTQEDAIQAQADALLLYDMLHNVLHRNGFCDAGEQLAIGVDMPKYWLDPSRSPPFGEPIGYSGNYFAGLFYSREPIGLPMPQRFAASMGLTAHAWAHHFMERCVSQAGMEEPEANAIIESFADSMGVTLKAYAGYAPESGRWKIDNGAGLILRDLADPRATAQPIVYKNDSRWWPTRNGDMNADCVPDPDETNQWCGRAINSGVGNYAFYMLAQNAGTITTHPVTGVKVSGIGAYRALQIALDAVLRFWSPDMSYPLMAGAMINTASDIYGSNSNEKVQVQKAWQAVGVTPLNSDGNPLPTPRPCVGDCNGNGVVGVDDLLVVVNILLGSGGSCPNADANGDGAVTVGDIVILMGVANSSACIPSNRDNGLEYLPPVTLEVGRYAVAGVTSDVVPIPISIVNGDDRVSAVLFDLEADANRYSSVVCYSDPGLDDSFSFRLVDLPNAGGKLRKRMLITSDVRPVGVIPDGPVAVCEFDIVNGTPYGTYAIAATNVHIASDTGEDYDVVVQQGYVNLFRQGCSVGEPHSSAASILLLLPLLRLLCRRRIVLLLLCLVVLTTGVARADDVLTFPGDAAGSWTRSAASRPVRPSRAARVGLGSEGMAGVAAMQWFGGDINLQGSRISGSVRIVGASFGATSFSGRIRRGNHKIVGKLVNVGGRKVATVRAAFTTRGIAGRFKARNGEAGEFEWVAQDPVVFQQAVEQYFFYLQ